MLLQKGKYEHKSQRASRKDVVSRKESAEGLGQRVASFVRSWLSGTRAKISSLEIGATRALELKMNAH